MGVNDRDANDRNADSKPTLRFNTVELSRLAAESAQEAIDAADAAAAVHEWDSGQIATGTPRVGDTPLVSRTSTIHDPLTTAVLAEISRSPEAEVADAAEAADAVPVPVEPELR